MLPSLSVCPETAIVKYIDVAITVLFMLLHQLMSRPQFVLGRFYFPVLVLFGCKFNPDCILRLWGQHFRGEPSELEVCAKNLLLLSNFQLRAAAALLHYRCRAHKYEESGGRVAFYHLTARQ